MKSLYHLNNLLYTRVCWNYTIFDLFKKSEPHFTFFCLFVKIKHNHKIYIVFHNWETQEKFSLNLQSFFPFLTVVIIINHFLNHRNLKYIVIVVIIYRRPVKILITVQSGPHRHLGMFPSTDVCKRKKKKKKN